MTGGSSEIGLQAAKDLDAYGASIICPGNAEMLAKAKRKQ